MAGVYSWRGNNLLLDCYLQPKASRSEIAGVFDGYMKIRIAAPPVDGKANIELIKFLAVYFSIAKSRIKIVNGHKGRRKRVCIHALNALPEGFEAFFGTS